MANIWLNTLLSLTLASGFLLVRWHEPLGNRIRSGWTRATYFSVANCTASWLALVAVNWSVKWDGVFFTMVAVGLSAFTEFWLRRTGHRWGDIR